jgi:predicted  nucleic acid-binding Zn-ribbon protein
MEQAFRQILTKKGEIAELDVQLKAQQQDIDAIASDQVRLRENMKALKGSAEEKALLQRYTGQLDAQEDRLASLRSQISELTDKRQRTGKVLDRLLDEITLDENF